ncbi:MAG: phospho-N-acetylmuramoyl-pentapeptide-transferase [Oscillospiraceae bacterium]|nr:phospho-N-acetylmuramoyl-pentapeptide-transferase [Oscillospiraceae bacterium]
MLTIIITFFISLLLTVAAALIFIPMLRRLKAGQSIQEDGPVWHSSKEGTPTMGGIIFISAILITSIIMGIPQMRDGNFSVIFIMGFAVIYALIGFLDDFEKVKKHQNLGLRAKQKFALQLIAAVTFVLIMQFTGNLTTDVYVPFINITFSIPVILYYVFAAFVIVGTVNAVNITDGIDGLCTGVSVPVAAALAATAFTWGDNVNGIIAVATLGGLIGFLIFNFYPAKVFMGDTGSLFIGGLICALVFAMDMPLILITLGIVYFIETLSVIIQVSYFKLTKGKRVFKMAPIHHHFEMCGWSEYKLFTVFTAVSVVFAVLSYFGVSQRFG